MRTLRILLTSFRTYRSGVNFNDYRRKVYDTIRRKNKPFKGSYGWRYKKDLKRDLFRISQREITLTEFKEKYFVN